MVFQIKLDLKIDIAAIESRPLNAAVCYEEKCIFCNWKRRKKNSKCWYFSQKSEIVK